MYTQCRGDSEITIDFVVANDKVRELLKDTRVMCGFECKTDNYFLVLKIKLGQEWRRKRTRKMKQNRIKIENLQKLELQMDFQDRIYERIDRTTWDALICNKDIESA